MILLVKKSRRDDIFVATEAINDAQPRRGEIIIL